MVIVANKVKNLCMALIEQGQHIFTVNELVHDNYSLNETQFSCVKFYAKLAAAYIMKDRFIANIQGWLNKDFVIDFDNTEGPTAKTFTASGTQIALPCKDYEESKSTKKRKAVKMIREFVSSRVYKH